MVGGGEREQIRREGGREGSLINEQDLMAAVALVYL